MPGAMAPVMKQILITLTICLIPTWANADNLRLSTSFYENLGYRVLSFERMGPSSWEKKSFDVLEKSITKIKSIEQVRGEPNWYYRFAVTVERFPNPAAAKNRLKHVLKKPPELSPSENKAFPLRKAFQSGVFVYTVSTDVSMYYDVELDHVLNALREEVGQNEQEKRKGHE